MSVPAAPLTTMMEAGRRPGARSLLVFAFGVVEVDRLLGAVARLTGGPFGPPHPHVAMEGWVTAFDVIGAAIAMCALAYVGAYLRGLGWAKVVGTVALTAAAQHTALALLSLVFGGAGATDPVIVFAYVATSMPILVLAGLHSADIVTGFRRARDGAAAPGLPRRAGRSRQG